MTRTLAKGLVERGVETVVVTLRRKGQGKVEELDGFNILGYPPCSRVPYPLNALISRLCSINYYKKADCDIYHSQAVGYSALAAQIAMPERIHVITFQDPYDLKEWEKISTVSPRYKLTPPFRARLATEIKLLSRACRNSDALFSQARFLIKKAMWLYKLNNAPVYLPNPVEIPQRVIRKADEPMVCFLARWDPQKRVELFLEMARRFSEVKFVAMGRSHDPHTDSQMRRRYRGLQNLEMPGFVSETEKSKILERSWVLMNTSVREALPISFLEALAHETPVISALDPDRLTSRFGYIVTGEEYSGALVKMLDDKRRGLKGKRGKKHVKETHEKSRVIEKHINIYEALLEGRGIPP